jgi:predicted unusual protein kinase regulating ubiquinone biosynthesis (AarF/ABC1/UbiB family)
MPRDEEANSLGGRVRRYAKVGRAMSGLAVRVAGNRYLGIKIDKAEHAAELKTALGGLKGPLMKVAQIMATIPDALPREYVQELQQLQSNAPAMGWPFVKRRMAAELGEGWQSRFRDFEHVAAAAASLGQVHRAHGKDGRLLACKLQYPDMKSAVEADLRQLKLIFRLYERSDRAIATAEIHSEIGDRLREELDYQLEARHMALYRMMLGKERHIHLPEPLLDLTTKRLLTMTWIEGLPLMQFLESTPPVELRNQVAMNMFRAWYVPFYEYGVIHGDPHLGNYTVRPIGAKDEGDVNLMDFGCVRIFEAKFVKGVIDLYFALLNGDNELAVHAYESWGFKNLSKEIIAVLNRWAHFIYGPLLEDRARKIQDAESGVYGREVAEGVHADLRRLGPVTPPKEFVFMDRAAIGLGSVFMHLKAEINWYRLFHDLIEDFDPKILEKRQKAAMKKAGIVSAVTAAKR